MDWLFLTKDGRSCRFCYQGLNPLSSSADDWKKVLQSLHKELPAEPEIIGYYGAGCSDKEVCNRVMSYLSEEFKSCRNFKVDSDLQLAAIATQPAMLSDGVGIVAIIGTGSNTGLFNGTKLIKNIRPLGYVLGDEGSGASLGKLFLKNIYRNLAPDSLIKDFEKHSQTNYSDVLKNVYGRGHAGAYLASFAPFILKKGQEQDEDGEFCRQIIIENLRSLFSNVITKYVDEELPSHPQIYFLGGLAFAMRGEIFTVAKEFGFNVRNIEKNPLDCIEKNLSETPEIISNLF